MSNAEVTAPAVPLEKAVAEARDALAEWQGYPLTGRTHGSRAALALRSLLAALDADRGEAEAALKPLAALAVEYEKMSLPDGTAIVTVQKNDPAGNVVLLISDAVRARRYFARREEKEVPE